MDTVSGYCGYSKSNNAAAAERNGRFPLSRIGTGPWFKLAASVVGDGEWHHSSKFYNRVKYFEARAVRGAVAALKRLGRTPAEAEAALTVLRAERQQRDPHRPAPISEHRRAYVARRRVAATTEAWRALECVAPADYRNVRKAAKALRDAVNEAWRGSSPDDDQNDYLNAAFNAAEAAIARIPAIAWNDMR